MSYFVGPPAPKRWTISALECYDRGCVCSGCFYDDFFGKGNFKCQMKFTVLELVRRFGIPTEEERILILKGRI